jgi:hypothetical protein
MVDAGVGTANAHQPTHLACQADVERRHAASHTDRDRPYQEIVARKSRP